MELDRELLTKVMGLSDDDLRDAVTRVALGLGLDGAMLKPYLAQTDRLRAAVKNLKPEDLDRVAAVLGEDRLRETLAQVEQEVNGVE